MGTPRLILALAMLAGAIGAGMPASAEVSEQDVLGPGARQIDDGHWIVTLADGTELLTHGTDPVPDHGSSLGPGDPEREPLCASDYYLHALYGRRTGSPDRYASVVETIRASIRRMNGLLNEASLESGDKQADYKVLCDADDQIVVNAFTSGASDYSSIVDAARASGFTDARADYLIFFDDMPGGSVCGVGNFSRDERLVESNLNNSGADYGVAYNECWTNATAMHENGHNQGAVQANAPHSTGSGAHCNDENDVMCYAPDGGDKNQSTVDVCTDRMHYDCGHDTYFDSEPEAGEWLASHWNIGSDLNRFIAFGVPERGPPRAALRIDCSGLSCRFTDVSIDDGPIASAVWDFGDGQTATGSQVTHLYEGGTYLTRLTVTDADGETDEAVQTLTVPTYGDPDPSTETLESGVEQQDASGPRGSWHHYKIYVPQHARSFTVTLSTPGACILALCNPDLDLFVARGIRPTRDQNLCASEALSNTETCSFATPPSGYYYIGVYTFFAPLPIGLSSTNFRVVAEY